MRVIREVLRLAMRRLCPGDFYAGDAAAEITLLRDFAGKVVGEVRTDILKAVAILSRAWRPADRIPSPRRPRTRHYSVCLPTIEF
jgi:hypothetical protein